jgi:hypothetical protein
MVLGKGWNHNQTVAMRYITQISNNTSFRLKHPSVPDGSDGSDGTSYPLTENFMLPVAQVTRWVE